MIHVAEPKHGPKIEVRGLTKYFRWETKGRRQELLVLEDVELTVAHNEFVAVIGPSGCGKTTLLRTIAGLAEVDTGEIRIDGERKTGPGPERAMVFQSFGLFPWKTVLDNVKFPLHVRKVPDTQAEDAARRELKRVGLDGFEHHHPHQLSGGMQQRVGLARALATDADILLMDEPFGSIDAQTRTLMQEELLQLCGELTKTVLFVTHDLDEALLLADRVIVLSRGPGKVREAVEVELPRPRWGHNIRGDRNFVEARDRIWSLLRQDLTEAGHGRR